MFQRVQQIISQKIRVHRGAGRRETSETKNQQQMSNRGGYTKSKTAVQRLIFFTEFNSRPIGPMMSQIWRDISGLNFESASCPSNIGCPKSHSWVTKRAITFEREVGLGRAAPCGVQNSYAELIVTSVACKMKSVGLESKLEVTHTSSIFQHKMQILTFLPNALNNWERFDMAMPMGTSTAPMSAERSLIQQLRC